MQLIPFLKNQANFNWPNITFDPNEANIDETGFF